MSTGKNVVPEAKEALNRLKLLPRKVYKYIKENSGMPILSQILATAKITVLAFKNIKNTKIDT